MKALRKAKKELSLGDNKKINELNGLVGSKGKAVGRVAVVFTNKDLNKVKAGDILVTSMTRQDFVPAISRCAALVTDEGSIICHAAIIAREFKIPCVVGTKVATEFLKDGDLVEINANKGIIKKIR
ncbi:MAG: hypothetical protein HY979_02605 [Candidatus Magasanikbacteria bacterium]|nr:hypothetical protein [Candidatus Magasanikbacteria bacterium]